MADTNATGSVHGEVRQGSIPVRHTLIPTPSSSTTAISTGIVIKASTFKPAIVEAQVYLSTTEGGTSPTISVGYTASGYTDLINAAATDAASAFLPASNATGKKYLTADTEIYYKRGGTPDGTGSQTIILDIATVNTLPSP